MTDRGLEGSTVPGVPEADVGMRPPALRVIGVSKTFGGAKALDDVSFDVAPGEIHALLGGNGSGKSTLIKILAGVYHADEGGRFEFSGTHVPAHLTSVTVARQNRVRFVHQDPGLFSNLTVADNIAMRSGFPTRFGRIQRKALHRRVATLLDDFEIAARPGDLLGGLRPADQTMVAIARALERTDDQEPSLLVLDEPTASLPQSEVDVLLASLRRRAGMGQGMIYVSHRIDEVLSIADRITVLRDGRHVITRAADGATESVLTEHIAGRPIDRLFGEVDAVAPSAGAPLLTVRNAAVGPLRDVSFDLRRGEILGVAGLLGSGRSELLRVLFGALKPEAGVILLDGVHLEQLANPAAAMRHGMALVPEDRTADAAFGDLTVQANLSMAQIPKYRRALSMAARAERLDARRSVEDFRVRPRSEAAIFSTLSGGNQQKVVVARWMRRTPRVLLLDEPTQGVDVGARADIYAAVREATAAGMSVVLVSSDFEELVHASDRVIVLHDGVIAGELAGQDLTREALTYMTYTGKAMTND